MPLQQGKSRAVIQANIRELIENGHSPSQAAAIAYKEAGEAKDVVTSARDYDDYGWLEVKGNPISKVGVFPYLGKQIAGAPEPDKIYMVYRPAEELANQETLDSFKLLPFVNEHPSTLLGAGTDAEEKGVEGVIGEDVYFDEPYLRGNIKIFSRRTTESIDAGKIELSPGYQCEWDFTSGSFNGERYDVVQRNIRGNHLALVTEGRSGPDVSVMDSMTIVIDSKELVMAEENKAAGEEMTLSEVVAVLKEIGPQIAELTKFMGETRGASTDDDQDGDDPVMDEDDKDEDKKDDDKKEEAMDAMSKELKALRAELAALKSSAMDSGKVMADIAEAKNLAERVSQHFGSFAHDAMDKTAVAVYGCEKAGLKVDKTMAVAAIEAWLHGRPVNRQAVGFAQDDKSNSGAAFLAEQFK